MTENYKIVPWYNREEWLKVYNDLLMSNQREALNSLLLWKTRCPSLPSGIESTLSLLQVLVQDISNESDNIDNDQLLRLAYSSAIMRFVNHMLDTETAKGSSLYRAAKNRGVPYWIVELRHDTAHSNNLPALTLLREACMISLQWLQKNYWDKHKEYIQDYLSGQKQIKDITDGDRVTTLVNFAAILSICAHPYCKIKKLSEIQDVALKNSILNDANYLFGNQKQFSNLKAVYIESLINLTEAKFRKELNGRDVEAYVSEALLGDDSLFLSKELYKHFGEKSIKNKYNLKRSYMQCFEVLLTMLHKNELLLEFILSLIRITQCTGTEPFKAYLAALWVSEILTALNESQSFIGKLEKMDLQEITLKTKNELKQLYNHWFPNDKVNHLILDLATSIPKELTDVNFIQPIISKYNPYLNYFIRSMLNIVEPPLPLTIAEKICKLAELISLPKKVAVSTSKIYTASDLNIASNNNISSIENNDKMDVHTEGCESLNTSIWRLASAEHSWSTCPLGMVPWQLKADCAIVMETV